MPFDIKPWANAPDTSTPISADSLQDLEERLSTYTDDQSTLAQNSAQATALGYTNDQIATHSHDADNPIPTVGIVDGAITNAKLASNAVNTTQLVDGSVTGVKAGAGVAKYTSGTFATRPAQPVLAGTYYYATDTDVMYVSNGAAWKEVAFAPVTAAKIEAQQAWQTVPLGGGATWAPSTDIKFYKDSLGRVNFGGTTALPSVDVLSGTIATLPAGYRPAGGCVRLVYNYVSTVANSAKVSISSAGVITISGAGFLSSQSYDFGSMSSFRAEN